MALYLFSTLYMMWKVAIVEGVLDGSMDKEGVVLKPRVVEVRFCSERMRHVMGYLAVVTIHFVMYSG